MAYIYSDFNVRLKEVDNNDVNIIHDSKAVMQSLYRLLGTEVGEIPFYRNYGLNLKQFVQKPLNTETAESIYNYVEERIKMFEPRVEILDAQTEADWVNSAVVMVYKMMVIDTGDVFTTTPFIIPVGG